MVTLLRLPEVIRATGYSRSTLLRLIAKQEFPAPVRIGPRAIAFPSNLVEDWIHSRIAASRRAAA